MQTNLNYELYQQIVDAVIDPSLNKMEAKNQLASIATLMLNNGCPMSVLQELLGHDDIQTTGIYAKQMLEHKQQSYTQYFYQ